DLVPGRQGPDRGAANCQEGRHDRAGGIADRGAGQPGVPTPARREPGSGPVQTADNGWRLFHHGSVAVRGIREGGGPLQGEGGDGGAVGGDADEVPRRAGGVGGVGGGGEPGGVRPGGAGGGDPQG